MPWARHSGLVMVHTTAPTTEATVPTNRPTKPIPRHQTETSLTFHGPVAFNRRPHSADVSVVASAHLHHPVHPHLQ